MSLFRYPKKVKSTVVIQILNIFDRFSIPKYSFQHVLVQEFTIYFLMMLCDSRTSKVNAQETGNIRSRLSCRVGKRKKPAVICFSFRKSTYKVTVSLSPRCFDLHSEARDAADPETFYLTLNHLLN